MSHIQSELPQPPAAASITRSFIVANAYGLHARPAALFVKVACRFKSEFLVEKDGEVVNGKSIMGLMMLAAGKGTLLNITVRGVDAEAAMQAIEPLFRDKFNEP